VEIINSRMFNMFNYWGRTTGDIGKWIAQLDSAHQIGLETCSNEIFIALGGWCSGGDI
jgi:hypothetical protein